MKKIVACILTLGLLVLLTGCSREYPAAVNIPDIPDIAATEDDVSQRCVVLIDGTEYSLEKDEISSFVSSLNSDREERTYPHIEWTEDKIGLSEWSDGNILDTKKLEKYILSGFESGGVSINTSDFLVSYDEDIAPSEVAAEMEEKIKPFNDFEISYMLGEEFAIADIKDFIVVSEDSVGIVTEKTLASEEEEKVLISDYIKDILGKKLSRYNSYYEEWNFDSTLRGEVKIVSDPAAYCSSTYGSKLDIDKEAEYIFEKVLSLESEDNRTPFLLLENGFEIPDTYVEVSIEDQHLWYYKNGELRLESNVVTGWKDKSDTPIGVYQISGMCHGIKFSGGTSGKNWMQFTVRGHGLHDATWRPGSDFENPETYLTSGSHGCVNLPLEFSDELYNAVSVGTVVVVF